MAQLPLDQAIPRFQANEDRLNVFANGDANAIYVSSDGVTVPSIQKFLASKDTQINVGASSVLSLSTAQATAASASATAAASSATAAAASAALSASAAFLPNGTGAVERTLVSKAKEGVSVKNFPATGNGSTNDSVAVQNSINAAGINEDVYLPDGRYLVSSNPTNKFGVEFTGPGVLVKPVAGGVQQINSYADKHKYIFGAEYLSAFHNKLVTQGAPPKALFSGDSTTAGGDVSVGYRMHELMEDYARAKGLNTPYGLNFINRGFAGWNTEMWRSYELNNDIAMNPDLYVIRWGINDPGYYQADFTSGPPLDAGQAAPGRRTANDFLNSLRAGLGTIRASKSVAQLSIVLMTPNSTSDTPNGRDELWYEQIIPGIKQAARDYQCVFVDTYGYLRDSRPAAGVWMDNPMPGGGRAIHPGNLMNTWIAGLLGSVVFPDGLQAKEGANNVTVIGGAEDIGDPNRLPSTYKRGITMSRSNAAGFPFDGLLYTIRSHDEIVIQHCYPYKSADKEASAYRIGRAIPLGADGATWGAWQYHGNRFGSATPSTGFTMPTVGGWRAAKSGTVTVVEGYINKTTTSIIAANTELAILPAGFSPQREIALGYFATLWDGGTFEPLLTRITPAGQVQILKASTLSAVRVYINATWNSGNTNAD